MKLATPTSKALLTKKDHRPTIPTMVPLHHQNRITQTGLLHHQSHITQVAPHPIIIAATRAH